MELKVVVSDPKTGKSYQVDVKDDDAKKLRGKKIGDTFEGIIVGLAGYKLRIAGGSDRGGFPMRPGIHSNHAQKILAGNGVGFKAKGGQRARRRMHGEVIGDSVVQVNACVTEYGSKKMEDVFKPQTGDSPESKTEG